MRTHLIKTDGQNYHSYPSFSKNSGGDATDGDTTATDGDATAQEGDANRDWAEQTENVFPLKEAEIQGMSSGGIAFFCCL